MEPISAFTHTKPELLSVLDELRLREPVFHTPEFDCSAAGLERAMPPEYREVGASGRRYSRAFILHHMSQNPPESAERLGWRSWDQALLRLGTDTYLMTYTLQQIEPDKPPLHYLAAHLRRLANSV